jgi:HAD superfamily hydrolase (TIGR01509 family)
MDLLSGIGFDLDHTLAIDNKLERVALMRLLELVLDNGGRALGTLADESDRIDGLLQLQREGAFSIDEAVRRFVAERGVPASDLYVERFRAIALEMVGEFVIPLPGVKQTLEALRERGIALAVLSNGWNPLQILKAQRAGFFGPVLASADIGAEKPAKDAYEALLRALASRPDETWYVGDDPWTDISGAHDAGIQAIWIDWEGKQYPRELLPPSHTIQRFEELLELLPTAVRVS